MLNGDYDTVTLHEWKQLRAEAPPRGTALLPKRQDDGPPSAPERSCEWCGAEIAADADRRRRFCSSSCRARAAKRRKPKPVQPPVPVIDAGFEVAQQPAAEDAEPALATAAAPGGSTAVSVGDLVALTDMTRGLLACDGVGEVEFRVLHWTVVVRR